MKRIDPVIYLDMDGVCADFVTAAIRAHSRNPDDIRRLWDGPAAGMFDLHRLLHLRLDDFWERIDAQGERFWIDLAEFPWFLDLHAALNETAPVIFLSSPTRAPSCLSGKMAWLQRRFGPRFRDFILTGHKQQLAHPNAALIDDSDRNIRDFQRAGGEGILFPQPWNSAHALADDRIGETLRRVEDWIRRVRS